jgi:hypothetical protein
MSDGQPHFVPPSNLRCRFVKTSGARCTQPALRDHDLCFDHKYKLRVIRGQVRRLQREEPFKVPLVKFAQVEDHHSVLRNLNEIAQQLANGAIDVRQAAAFTSLMRTCLKTLRQMHDIEQLQPQVEAYVEVDGQPMALPEDSPAVAASSPEPADCPAAQSSVPSAPHTAAQPDPPLDDLDDEPLADEPIDAPPRHEHAPPRVPGLSFNPRTEEGRRNLGQEYIWGYCHQDPVKGLEFGIDLNWPGRPAGFVPPTAQESGPSCAEPAFPPAPAPAPELAAHAALTLNAAADPPAADRPVSLMQALVEVPANQGYPAKRLDPSQLGREPRAWVEGRRCGLRHPGRGNLDLEPGARGY